MEIIQRPKSEVEIKTSVAADVWEKLIPGAIESIAKNFKFEGFRPGKAPRNLVEQKVGKEAILEEAVNRAIQKEWERIFKEEKDLHPLAQPKAENLSKIEEGKEITFSLILPVMPEATMKKGWEKNVAKLNKKHAEKKVDVDESVLDEELERLAKSRAKIVAVDRAAQMDDAVVLDFQVMREGVPIEGGSALKQTIVLGSGAFIPGFEEKIEGMKAGEEKDFELHFPEKYHEKMLAGKEASFHVTVHAVQERQIPAIDDDFAKGLGKFDNLESLKKSFREGMLKEEEAKQEQENRTELLQILADNVDMDIPDILVHEELHQMIQGLEAQLANMGMGMEGYLKQIGKTIDDIEKEWEGEAQKRVRSTFATEAIAKDREVEATSEEIEAEMNKALSSFKNLKEAEKKLDMQRLHAYSQKMVVHDKVFEYLKTL